jgi:hypothetical protein
MEKMFRIPELKSQYVWIVVLLVYISTGFIRLGSPFQMSQATLDAYNYIEGLQPGGICMLAGGNVFAFDLESTSGQIAAIKQIAGKGLRLVSLPLGIEGIAVHKYCIDAAHVDQKYGGPWKYGIDYAILPYTPGGYATVVAFLTNVWATVFTDIYGTPLSQIPIFNDLHSYKDIVCWFQPHWAAEGYTPYVIGQFGITFIYFSQAGGYLPASVYMNVYPGKFFVTNGFLGGAQYEKLVGAPGLGYAAVDSYTLLSAVVLVFVVLGNLTLLSSIREEKEQVEVKK